MPDKITRIALLGSTGSIGTQSLDVIARYPGKFKVETLVAGNNADILINQALKFKPSSVVIGNPEHYLKIKQALAGSGIEVCSGTDEACRLVSAPEIDVVIASIVGYSGLRPTIAAIKKGKKIALANKETLVVAGSIIEKLASEYGSVIVPVDSEHSAIFQCLVGEEGNPVEKITLTASGGPFLNWTIDKLKNAKPSDALKHPNWDMGCKVTIDSASMMNKGLEVIEAKWLFRLAPEQIDVMVHPQSIIHSLVHFADGSVKAQMGIPDMRLPILYALSWPQRFKSALPRLDLKECKSLTFVEPDIKRFRNLSLAFTALGNGGNMPCMMNAANEIAVDAFLKEKVGFMQMPEIVEHAMTKCDFHNSPDLEMLEATDCEARSRAAEYISKLRN
ncbi:MAG TPA: 1-deoxy-D-xylulose-5-phosphate reductoisomerase [Bacteroidales bacterium]|nr:1-deoxy-D-xylulose-5-phosphate reductoisomerase [Bacteroidales bacterium]